MRKKESEKSDCFKNSVGKIQYLANILKNLYEVRDHNNKQQTKQIKEYEAELEKYKSVIYSLYRF